MEDRCHYIKPRSEKIVARNPKLTLDEGPCTTENRAIKLGHRIPIKVVYTEQKSLTACIAFLHVTSIQTVIIYNTLLYTQLLCFSLGTEFQETMEQQCPPLIDV